MDLRKLPLVKWFLFFLFLLLAVHLPVPVQDSGRDLVTSSARCHGMSDAGVVGKMFK